MNTYKVESYDPGMKYSNHFRERMARFVRHDLNVTSLLELGCGPGRFLEPYTNMDVEFLGVDGCNIPVDELRIPSSKFLMMNLIDKDPLVAAVRGRFERSIDCIVSLETLEHLSPEHDHTFFEIIKELSPTWVVMSVARPGQAAMPGEAHPNCQEVDDVISKMSCIKYALNPLMSDGLRSMMLAPTSLLIGRPWADFYQRNTRVYERMAQ